MEHPLASIFVIDDEPHNREVVELLLSPEPYQVTQLESAAALWTQLEISQPDVILLDVMMPIVNGLEVCQQLKQSPQWQHIPVVMVTALSSKEDLKRCIDAGADDFIGKPINGTELRSRVRSMLRIKKQHDALKASLQLRQDLVHMLVHDLRNPLANIVLSTDLLQTTELQPKQAQKIDQIQVSCRQLQTMIDSLLMTAQLKAGRMQLHYQVVDLSRLGQQVIEDFSAIASQKYIQIIGEVPQSAQFCYLDEAVFRRILDNLLSNAIKFSPRGSCIKLQIEDAPTDFLKICVIDEGKGIRPELRDRIFESFEIGEFNEEVSQIGLGLAFCKMAIEAHGGSIDVDDNYPSGSIFTLKVPCEIPG
jgi:two-component system, sensor histidine kinase and response regulator